MQTDNRDAVDEFIKSVEQQLETFTHNEAERLAIPTTKTTHWRDANPTRFTAQQREHTTILFAGLTMAQDLFIQAAFRGLGYQVEAMDVPDSQALQYGREFGNRGQCNPTYFTVGNLIKKLHELEASGLSRKQIIENYLFATAGSCGPCRFGTYVTEYRKALRDAGFEGFRVVLFQQAGGIKQATGEEMGLNFDAKFFITICKAILLGDVLNALSYRIRPYEVNPGETDKVLTRAKARIADAFEKRKGLLKILWQTRRELAAIKVDRTQIKPRVAIIGEFWAMTTEGEGNYRMHRFLEQEGAEVDIQLVTNWGLYLIWAGRYDTLERAKLKGTDPKLNDQSKKGSKFALRGVDVGKKLLQLRVAEGFLRGLFGFYAKVLGLKHYHLPNMEHIAEISHRFYDNNLRGGEGHMEVGKMIHNVVDQTVNMTLSIKPFGCMPSSGVSDGVQSLMTELYPTAIFLPIETNGDGAVNVYSRVQMQLFKARQIAEKEVGRFLHKHQLRESFEAAHKQVPAINSALYRSRHFGACSALDLAEDIHHRQQRWDIRLLRNARRWLAKLRAEQRKQTLLAVERAVARLQQNKNEGFEDMAVRIMDP